MCPAFKVYNCAVMRLPLTLIYFQTILTETHPQWRCSTGSCSRATVPLREKQKEQSERQAVRGPLADLREAGEGVGLQPIANYRQQHE